MKALKPQEQQIYINLKKTKHHYCIQMGFHITSVLLQGTEYYFPFINSYTWVKRLTPPRDYMQNSSREQFTYESLDFSGKQAANMSPHLISK